MSNFEGEIIQGRYRVVRELGRGGMGIVLEVENVLIKKRCALKLIEIASATPLAVRRLQREAKVLSELDHPNIVKALDFGLLDDDTPYVLMELIEGRTLSDYLKGRRPLNEDEAKALFVPILGALEYAHSKKVVHRDLKPANIMLIENVGSVQPKLLDFGLALPNELTAEALTRTGTLIGTPLYMSPEQASSEEMTNRSDIYSLGCVMFEALTGAPPFSGRTPLETLMMHKNAKPPSLTEASLGLSFSRNMESIVIKMLAKDPSDRYQSCSGVIDALSSRHVKVKAEKARSRSWWAIGGSVVCVAATGSVVFFASQKQRTPLSTAKQIELAQPVQEKQESYPPSLSEDNDSPDMQLEVLKPGELQIGESGGIRNIVLHGTHHRIGSLRWVDAKAHEENLSDTPIPVPLYSTLWFQADLAVVHNPAILQSFGPLKLSGMLFKLPQQGKESIFPIAAAIALIPPAVPGLSVERGAIYAKEAASITARNFRWLSLNSCGIGKPAADALAAMPDLESLALARLDDVNSGDARGRVTTILQGLTSQKSSCPIRRLSVARTKFDAEICRCIGKMHHLQFLNIVDSLPDHFYLSNAFALIGSKPELTELALNTEWLSDSAVINMQQNFKNLKRIYLKNPEYWKPQLQKQIATLFPGSKVIFTTNPNIGFEPWEVNPERLSSSVHQ